MRITPRVAFSGLLKFLVVAIAAGAVGLGIGVGLAALTGDESASSTPQTTRSSPGAAAQTTTATEGLVPRVRVLSAVLRRASTQSGRDRRRAQVTVRVRVTSRGTGTLDLGDPLLMVGSERVGLDPDAEDAAGALLEPLAPGVSATGELRFETAGAVTRRLTKQRRARLHIADRTVAVRSIDISREPVSSD